MHVVKQQQATSIALFKLRPRHHPFVRSKATLYEFAFEVDVISHLPCLALGVDLAQPRPLTKLLRLRHGQQADVLLGAQRLDELLVVGLIAVLRQDA